MMEFEGRVWKSERSKYWVADVEMLDLSTQGTSRSDALSMVKDAIEALVHKKGFRALVTPGVKDGFTVSANYSAAWLGFLLQRLRMKEGLTIEQVARNMGFTSKTAYARYEQGKVTPSLEKFFRILQAIAPAKKPIFRLAA